MTAEFEKLFLAPKGKCQYLFGYRDHTLQKLCKLNSWSITRATAVGDNGWIACRESKTEIRISRFDCSNGLVAQRNISVDVTISIVCIAIDGSRLYAGGSQQTAVERKPRYSTKHPWVGWLDLSKPESEWLPLTDGTLHEDLPHKCVDAFAFSPGHLIAFDNIVEPLFAIRFNRGTVQRAPTFTDIVGLPVHNTYETIQVGAYNERYVAYLSSGINHGTSGQYISVSDHDRFPNEHAVFSQYSHGFLLRDSPSIDKFGFYTPNRGEWQDMDLCGNYLAIAAGEKGMGLADVKGDDGVAYVAVDGLASMVTAMPTGTNDVALSIIKDGAWKTELRAVPVDELCRAQEQALLDASPTLPSILKEQFSIRYGLSKTDLLPLQDVPFKIFVRDGSLYVEMPRLAYRNEKLASISAEIWMATVRSRMDKNELPESPYRVDLSEHSAEQVCTFLNECIEIAQKESG